LITTVLFFSQAFGHLRTTGRALGALEPLALASRRT
jgi:hypothetical protein